MTNRLREIWARGGTAVNAWLSFEGAASAGLVAAAGFDSVTVDLQHGAATMDGLAALLPAVEGPVPMVRLPWNDPAAAMRALDLGARGAICPMISTPADAEAFVRACRYPPEGERSYGPVRAAFGVGREQVEGAGEAVLTFAMIETAEALRRVDEIAGTPGLDGLYVGPADLSLALGLSSFADLADPDLLAALDLVVAAARSSGIVAGVHAPSPERSVEMAERGFRFVTPLADDALLARGAAEALARTRERLEAP